MKHALALGALGFVVNILGTVATWNMNLAPAWFTLARIALTLPCAWLGGKLRISLPWSEKNPNRYAPGWVIL
jgi:hypothetical protein